MELNQTIQVAPESMFQWLIFATLIEDDKTDVFTNANHDWWKNDEDTLPAFKVFLREQLIPVYEESDKKRQLGIRYALQFLLNKDEFTPYTTNRHRPELKCKERSWAQDVRDQCQDTITPYDGYLLCELMWEILFENEDWHVDISKWVVVEPKPYIFYKS